MQRCLGTATGRTCGSEQSPLRRRDRLFEEGAPVDRVEWPVLKLDD